MRNWFRSKLPDNKGVNETPKVINGKPVYNGVAPKERWDQIEYVFTSGGKNYFKFCSEVNIPFQRAIAARDILTEELWQINPDQLQGWVKGLISVITDEKKKGDKKIFEIGVLAHRLKEQIEMSFSLTRTMKLATVLYFDEQENPLDYQYPYNAEKIKHWMSHNDVQGFFLKLPEILLMPSGQELAKNFPTYLQAETMSRINDLRHIITILSLDNTDNDLMKDIQSQMEILNDINSWSKDLYTNTTSSTTDG
jgi:hypothetical protein